MYCDMAIPYWDGDSTELAASLGRKLCAVSMETNGDCGLGRWLTYQEAAAYTGWSIGHLRNLVSANRIPWFGRRRSVRFRRDLLDLFLTNQDMAMRKFRLERNKPDGR
jgi:excisionase family DNA binding protein